MNNTENEEIVIDFMFDKRNFDQYVNFHSSVGLTMFGRYWIECVNTACFGTSVAVIVTVTLKKMKFEERSMYGTDRNASIELHFAIARRLLEEKNDHTKFKGWNL